MPTRLGAEGQVRGVQRFTVLITPLHTVTQERSDESALYRIGDRFYIVGGTPTTLIRLMQFNP